MKPSAAPTVFGAVFAIVYLVAVEQNYALFTYHAALGEFGLGVEPPRDGPAMYWYGWLATSGLVAAASSVGAALLPARLATRIAPSLSWIVAVVVIAGFAWLLRGFFIR